MTGRGVYLLHKTAKPAMLDGMDPTRLVKAYYVATALFLALDALFGINVRIAFLDGSWPWRLAYYGICFTCLGLMVWRPRWTVIIAGFESLVTLVALIISFWMRILLPYETAGVGAPLGLSEIVNFLLAGTVAYFTYSKGVKALQKKLL